MSRIDIIQEALPSQWFINLCHRPSDDELQQRFASLSPLEQQSLVALATPRLDHLLPEVASEVEQVARHFAYRLIGTEDLPLFLRRVLLFADDADSADVLLLSALTTASICLPHYSGSLMDECVRPPLYTLITGNAASGKGRAALCLKLFAPVDEICATLIAGNSSATAIYQDLASQDERGFIFETEADTLSQAFKVGGNFADGLCKAFHNEKVSYGRRTNNERVVMQHPELAILLTGTPAQLGRFFPSGAENGLFSRFCHYRLHAQGESFVESSALRAGITAGMVNSYLSALGLELRDLFVKFARKSAVAFGLTAEQNSLFLARFRDLTQAYCDLTAKAYQDDVAVDEMRGICHRMGNICYRMLMVLSALRVVGREEVPDGLGCDVVDFGRVDLWSEVLMHHMLIHFDDLAVILGYVGSEDQEPNLDSPDLLNEDQRYVWGLLPDSFTTKDALLVGKGCEVSMVTIKRYLRLYCELGMLTRCSKGVYRKM